MHDYIHISNHRTLFLQCQTHWFPKGNGDILNSIKGFCSKKESNLITMLPDPNLFIYSKSNDPIKIEKDIIRQ